MTEPIMYDSKLSDLVKHQTHTHSLYQLFISM